MNVVPTKSGCGVCLWIATVLLMSAGAGCGDTAHQKQANASLDKRGMNIGITIVYDNNPYDKRLQTAWGFACLIEGLEKTILFDTGGSSSMLLSNMQKLGIDVQKVDAVVISHIHSDHCGGLAGFLQQNHKVTVYLPRSFPERMKKTVRESGAKLVEVHKPVKICRNAHSTGELGTSLKEQSLIIQTGKGLVLVTGCAHPGIVNVVKSAKKQLGDDVYLALGGFHLCMAGAQQIEQIIKGMQHQGVKAVAPSHCSGDEARRLFERAYGKDFIRLGVGRKLEVAKVEVCIYAGSGAVRAHDVEVALEKLGIPYTRADESSMRKRTLEGSSVLIMPGGHTGQIMDSLGKESFEHIRQFVSAGGGYIGICAGAYLAAETVEVPGRPQGLGIIAVKNHRRAGEGIKTIAATKSDHPVLAGCKETMQIWYENGPAMEPGEGVETLATYADGSAAVVCSTYGKGRVILFSPHPEGSLKAGVDPIQIGTLRVLGNAIAWVSAGQQDRGPAHATESEAE